MDYASFVRSQWQDLMDAWLGVDDRFNTPTAYIALPNIDWVTKLEEPRYPGGGGRWVPLGDTAPTQALVRHDARSRPQLWVRPEEKAEGDGRYAAYWAAFVKQLGHAAPTSEVAGRKMAVDHLFPETAAARRGWHLVRIMPVDRRSNSLLGSTTEKVDANRSGKARARTATALTMAKVSGFQGSFAMRHDPAAIATALLAHLRTCGLHVPDGAWVPDDEETAQMAWLIEFHRR